MKAPTIPFCQTVSQFRLCASRALEAQSVPVPCKNLRAAGCSSKKKTSHSGDPEDGPISPHQASSWSALPGGLQGGWWVWTVPMGPPKTEKRVLTLWLVREQVTSRMILYSQGEFSLRICSVDWFHIRGRYLTAQDVIPTRDYQRHQWLVVNRELLECARRSY